MSAERGWIGKPQQETTWHESRYSREADWIREFEEAQRRGEEHKWYKMMGAAHLLPPSPSPDEK